MLQKKINIILFEALDKRFTGEKYEYHEMTQNLPFSKAGNVNEI